MFSAFFIERPIFASIISVMLVLAGYFSWQVLPVELFPNITPPQILVMAQDWGADAETVATAVASPLESAMQASSNIIYMYSQSSSSGLMILRVFCEIGAVIDMALMQNQINMVIPSLPEITQKLGVRLGNETPNILMLISLESPDKRYDNLFMSNYAAINIIGQIHSIDGVSDVRLVNDMSYAMRIWLKPDRLAQLGLTVEDVVAAIKSQNSDFTGGALGLSPDRKLIPLTIPIVGQGRFSEPSQFEYIILKVDSSGGSVLLKDVALIELGAKTYNAVAEINNTAYPLIEVHQTFNANALEVSKLVNAKMEEIAKRFPTGMTYRIPFDTSIFIKRNIDEVIKTIFEAAVLVSLVVFIFLQSWRAALIPLLAMLVSIVGSFAGLYLLGYSINNLTLFGMVLAIGIVVDDAIVVVENVERNIRELHLTPKEATINAMHEVTAPVIAIVCVLCAVFIPAAFISGIVGALYKQFAVTISLSMVISGFVALTLSPALAAKLLKPVPYSDKQKGRFQQFFANFTKKYVSSLKFFLNYSFLGAIIFIAIIISIVILPKLIPLGFIPNEDQGFLIIISDLPNSSSLVKTTEVSHLITDIAMKEPGVSEVIAVSGFSLLDETELTEAATLYVKLKDWDERVGNRALSSENIAVSLGKKLSQIPDANILTFSPPTVAGLGIVSGQEVWIESRGDVSLQDLEGAALNFLEAAKKRPELTSVNSILHTNNLQLKVDVDRYKAEALGIQYNTILETLMVLYGPFYVNDFVKFGRTFPVIVQGEAIYRESPENLSEAFLRSKSNSMVPLTSLIQTRYQRGANLVTRFNGFPAIRILANTAPGFSSGQAMIAIEEIMQEILTEEMSYEWAGLSYQEIHAKGSGAFILVLGILVVFFILSALYERWLLPFAVLLAVPLGILGAFLALIIRGQENNIYVWLGLVTLVALAAKNAILIVEFAILRRKEGLSPFESAITAARMRFRAILMTSLTFIFGVVPLILSTGPGSASRQSVGTGVFGGMITATILTLFFVPLFFNWIETWTERRDQKKDAG